MLESVQLLTLFAYSTFSLSLQHTLLLDALLHVLSIATHENVIYMQYYILCTAGI
jgi:hypothetical protein